MRILKKVKPTFARKHPVRWLYRFVFGCVFIFLATLLVASANGIMYNVKTRSFESTGLVALFVDNPPYTLTIDGDVREVRSKEIKIANIFPGFHTIELKKDGYFTWTKTDYLNPGQAIIHPGIRLFQDNPIIAVASSVQKLQLQAARVTPKRDSELDVRGQEIWVKPITSIYPITQVSDTFVLVARYSQVMSGVVWLPGKNQIALQLADEIRVIDRDGSNDTVLANLSSEEVTDFMITEDGSTLIYRDGLNVYQRPL